jgi:hypothetical protein
MCKFVEFLFNSIYMKNILFALLFFVQLNTFSQERSLHNYYWNEYDSYEAIIGAKNCYVRENPSINAKLIDSLQIGKPIKVIKSTENDLEIKGLNVSWVEVEYQTSLGTITKGFLWKGFVAVGFHKEGNYIYLTTIDKVEKKLESENYEVDNFSITVKLLDEKNVIIGQKTTKKAIGDSRYFENKTIGSLGLKELKNIYRISFSGEACGIPSFYYYFGWNGKEFLKLPEKYDVGDAGVFYHSENFIFPKEVGGKPNLILKQVQEAVNDDESGEKNTYVFDVTKHSETYKWDGQKAVFVSKSKPKKFKRKEN